METVHEILTQVCSHVWNDLSYWLFIGRPRARIQQFFRSDASCCTSLTLEFVGDLNPIIVESREEHLLQRSSEGVADSGLLQRQEAEVGDIGGAGGPGIVLKYSIAKMDYAQEMKW